jgi:hypothetical protein
VQERDGTIEVGGDRRIARRLEVHASKLLRRRSVFVLMLMRVLRPRRRGEKERENDPDTRHDCSSSNARGTVRIRKRGAHHRIKILHA